MTNDNDNDSWASPEFLHGMDVGTSLGRYEAESEAQRAFDMGEIELWLEHYRPKSLEEWDKWDAEHGENFKDRWKTQTTEDNS